jgi:predicted DsbA family dithiol-disulfide isomerase
MSTSDQVTIQHFSDVLCIWAYLGQIRIDELQDKFSEQVQFEYHYIQVFGAVAAKMEKSWQDRGGVEGYAKHVQEIAKKFPHIDIHPQLWTKNIPTSSASCHLFIKAIQNLIKTGDTTVSIDTVVWQIRLAFFRDLIDISSLEQQLILAKQLNLPIDKIKHQLNSGLAHAALEEDFQLKQANNISGSPTLLFNEGRQTLYGNVGYRLMEANINELLKEPTQHASWC